MSDTEVEDLRIAALTPTGEDLFGTMFAAMTEQQRAVEVMQAEMEAIGIGFPSALTAWADMLNSLRSKEKLFYALIGGMVEDLQAAEIVGDQSLHMVTLAADQLAGRTE